QALEVANKIRQHIESTNILLAREQAVKATVSIGIALNDGHPDYQHIIDRADEALYTAKSSGRNCCILAP
ncbi:MAG: diguanylate cyclase, partial [Methylobacter sp.]|nr:diguanylate cyclase [Methylobacter sp.]